MKPSVGDTLAATACLALVLAAVAMVEPRVARAMRAAVDGLSAGDGSVLLGPLSVLAGAASQFARVVSGVEPLLVLLTIVVGLLVVSLLRL